MADYTTNHNLPYQKNDQPRKASTYNAAMDLIDAALAALTTAIAGKANTALSNLASVAINSSLISDTDNVDDIGTSSKWWRTGFYKTSLEIGATDTTITRASAGQLAVEGVNVLMNGGALGTPASGDLSNCTGLSGGVNPNILINGGFSVSQRGTSFTSATTPANSDDTYLLDRWILLSDGNDIVDVSQELTTVPTGAYAAIKLDVETANKRAGVCQIIEQKNTAAIIGGVASLSFSARKGGSNSTLTTLRHVVASWSSTADVVTSDIISTWGTTGNDPTLATNWTIEGSGTVTLTTSYQTFTAANIAIDTASTKNVAVFLMLEESTATVGDLAYISNVKLEEGATTTDFAAELLPEELIRCQRYYQHSVSVGGSGYATGAAQTARSQASICYSTTMRVTPSNAWSYNGGGNVQNTSSLSIRSGTPSSAIYAIQSAAAGSTYWDGSINLSAEL